MNVSDPEWNDLAQSPRWRGVVAFIRNWVGPFDAGQGVKRDELDAMLAAKRLILPAAVREWYLLAGRWSQRGLSIWTRPEELELIDDVLWVLHDTYGCSVDWGVRIADFHNDNPPVICAAGDPTKIDITSFSQFVLAMIMNDVICDDEEPSYVELDRSALVNTMCLVTLQNGRFHADSPPESATRVYFEYQIQDLVLGKSRTPEGTALLESQRVPRR